MQWKNQAQADHYIHEYSIQDAAVVPVPEDFWHSNSRKEVINVNRGNVLIKNRCQMYRCLSDMCSSSLCYKFETSIQGLEMFLFEFIIDTEPSSWYSSKENPLPETLFLLLGLRKNIILLGSASKEFVKSDTLNYNFSASVEYKARPRWTVLPYMVVRKKRE